MHSQWLRESTDPSPRPRLVAPHEGAEPRTWEEGDDGERVADALIVYDKLSKGAKKIVDVLVDLPGEDISGESLASRLGLSGDQLTGTLASIGIRSKGVNRKVPFRYSPGPHGGTYSIEPTVATLFRWVRQAPRNGRAEAPLFGMELLGLARSLQTARQELQKWRGMLSGLYESVGKDVEPEAYKAFCGAREFELALLTDLLNQEFHQTRPTDQAENQPTSADVLEQEQTKMKEVPMAQSE